jgi:Polyketide cyclase / dehydrase and lipid transport
VSAIEANISVAAEPEALFERLAKLDNHWDLADRWVEVVSVSGDGDGGVVRLNGPFGLSRTARTTVEKLEAPRLIQGTAEIGEGTKGRVSWMLEPDGDGTAVKLRAELVDASPPDRAIWELGGRQWLATRLRATLERLRDEYGG